MERLCPKCHIFTEAVWSQEKKKNPVNINEEKNPIPYDCQGSLALLYKDHILDDFDLECNIKEEYTFLFRKHSSSDALELSSA